MTVLTDSAGGRSPTVKTGLRELAAAGTVGTLYHMNAAAVRFLLLVDDDCRAILLDAELKHIGDVIEDDGFIVESLLRGARRCPVPSQAALAAMSPAPSVQAPMRCFELH